jgi:Phosphopantetheine attachment site.
MSQDEENLFLIKFLDELGLESSITLDSSLDELGWDSLSVITAIAIFDEVYGKTLDVEKLNKCKTIRDILKLSEN